MLRWRMYLSRARTQIKNLVHAVLQRYNVAIDYVDVFGDGGRAELLHRSQELPVHSRESVVEQLQTADWLETQIGECEQHLEKMLYPSLERNLLDTLPCVGKVLSAVLSLEIGDLLRFSGADRLRLNVAERTGTPLADRELAELRQRFGPMVP